MATFNIEAGKTCKIDAGATGMTFEGPAIVVCIEGKDLEEINLPIQVNKKQTSENTIDLLNKVIKTAHEIIDARDTKQIGEALRSCVDVAEKITDVITKLGQQGL